MLWKILLNFAIMTTFSDYVISKDTYAYIGYYPNIHAKSVVTLVDVDSLLLCHKVCSSSGHNTGYCYGATYNSYTNTCYLHRDKYEMCNKRYWTKDTSPKGSHILHFPIEECKIRSPNAIGGYERSLGSGLCLTPAFNISVNTHSFGGTHQTGITDQLSCVLVCRLNSNCWGLDFNIVSNTCFFHFTTISLGQQNSLSNVNQWLKSCPSMFLNISSYYTQSTTPTTTIMPDTTTPFTSIPVMIGDNGICPSPFELVPNTTLTSASPVLQAVAVNTTEHCKSACLADATCLAADFDMMTNRCTFHTVMDVTMLNRGTQSCCSHYRKISCTTTRQCYSTPTGTVTFPISPSTNVYVTDPSTATKVTCEGMCFVRDVTAQTGVLPIQSSITITRGCDTTVQFQDGYIYSTSSTVTGTAGQMGFSQEQVYYCSDNLCNIISRSDVRSQLLYLPFDMNELDESGYMRHGSFWNGTRGQFSYDSFDKKKNKAALFDGQEMVCAPLNNIRIHPGTPEITITSWVKRTGTSPSLMGIFSQGTNNTIANSTETFKLTSTFTAPNLHFYTFFIFLDKVYQCSSETYTINQYQFVAVRVISATTIAIELFIVDNPTSTTAFPTTATVSCDIDASQRTVPFPISQDPFCVGGLYTNENVTPLQGDPTFFTGYLDEVRFFRGASLQPDTGLLAIYKDVD